MNRTFKPVAARIIFGIFLTGLLFNAGVMISGLLTTSKAISHHTEALEKERVAALAENESLVRSLQTLSSVSEASFHRVLLLGQFLDAGDTTISRESVERMLYHTEDCPHKIREDVGNVAAATENRMKSSYFGLLRREQEVWKTAERFFTRFDVRKQLQDQPCYRELRYSMDEFSQKLGEVNGTYSRIYASGTTATAGGREQEDALESQQQKYRYYGIGLIVSIVLLAPLVWIAIRELFFSTAAAANKNFEKQA